MGADWLKKQVQARAVPFCHFGRSIRFFDDDIAAIKAQHREVPRASVAPVRPITSGRRRAAA